MYTFSAFGNINPLLCLLNSKQVSNKHRCSYIRLMGMIHYIKCDCRLDDIPLGSIDAYLLFQEVLQSKHIPFHEIWNYNSHSLVCD